MFLSLLRCTSPTCWHTADLPSMQCIVDQIMQGSQTSSAMHAADAELWTTGSNDSCQLGHKGHDTQLHPSRVEALDAHGVCQVACGQQHMLAVADGGALCAWGAADSGQLGKPPQPWLSMLLMDTCISLISTAVSHSAGICQPTCQ